MNFDEMKPALNFSDLSFDTANSTNTTNSPAIDSPFLSQGQVEPTGQYDLYYQLNNDMIMKDFGYPSMLSPPGTPNLMPMRNPSISSQSSSSFDGSNGYVPPPQDWTRQRAESMSWNPEHSSVPMPPPMTHQRAMSLPHIGMGNDFSMMQMNFTIPKTSYSRKSSISSTSSDKTYVCTHPGCDRTFSRIQNLRSHMRCHLLTTPHACKLCGLGFRRTTDLQRHIRTMHVPNDQKPWGCPRCPKRFGRSDALKRHMTSRSKDHGCPGGPDLELLRQMEEQKKIKQAQKATLQTVVEGAIY
jgi:uncharacterized Zn-finger protein